MHFAARAAFIATVLMLPAVMIAQTDAGATIRDSHYGNPVDEALKAYPGAHGYQHGYEDGFHYGQWDRQMEVPKRPPQRIHEFKRARRGYTADMGAAKVFAEGYRKGFVEGYSDAYAGRSFSAELRLGRFGPMLASVLQRTLLAAYSMPPSGGGPAVKADSRSATTAHQILRAANTPAEAAWRPHESASGGRAPAAARGSTAAGDRREPSQVNAAAPLILSWPGEFVWQNTLSTSGMVSRSASLPDPPQAP
jgi:hypothetical protein